MSGSWVDMFLLLWWQQAARSAGAGSVLRGRRSGYGRPAGAGEDRRGLSIGPTRAATRASTGSRVATSSMAAWSPVRATLELRWEARLVEVDAVAAHWD